MQDLMILADADVQMVPRVVQALVGQKTAQNSSSTRAIRVT